MRQPTEMPFTISQPPESIQEEETTIDLRRYWRLLLRNKFGILGLGLLTSVVSALYMLAQDPIYESRATLLFETEQANITAIEEIYSLDGRSGNYITTQQQMLSNRNIAERVINRMGLLQHPEFVSPQDPAEAGRFDWSRYLPGFLENFFTKGAGADVEQGSTDNVLRERVIAEFRNRLSVTPIPRTMLVQVGFEATNPQLAADIANSVAETYIETTMEQRLSASQNASAWLSERVQDLRQTLDASEQRLQQFMETERLINLEGVTSLNAQELDELTTQSIDVAARRAELQATFEQIQAMEGRADQELLAVPALLDNASLASLKTELDSVDRQIAELSNRYGRNHPRMIALASEKAAVEDNLSAQIERVIASIESNYRSAMATERALLAEIERSKAEIQDINRKSITLRELERDVEVNQQLYDMFFTRIRETDEVEGLQTSDAIVVEPAVPAINPSKPERRRFVMLATLAGLGLGVGLAFLRDFLDNTIKVPGDIEDRLHAETLGVVPLAKAAKTGVNKKIDSQPYLGLQEEKHSGFAESIRTLRTGITLASLDNPHKVIAVTSSLSGEGKSTVAFNLAVSMGQMGKTLLIDADMRRPSMAKTLGMNPTTEGLSNLVAEGHELKKSCIYSLRTAGISVIPAGQVVPNPLELLSSQKFRVLLQKLGKVFDTIIIDTPPLAAVSDALVLGQLSDAVVYVVKADATPINTIKNGLKRLRTVDAHVAGVVLNQVDVRNQAYYGEADYYAGYYDSEGYGAGNKEATAT